MYSTSPKNFENFSLDDPLIGGHGVTFTECMGSKQTRYDGTVLFHCGIIVYDTTLVQRMLQIDIPITKQTRMLEVEQQHKHIGVICYNNTCPLSSTIRCVTYSGGTLVMNDVQHSGGTLVMNMA